METVQETAQTCLYENFLIGLLVLPFGYIVFPLVNNYFLKPIYEWIGEWCLDPDWKIWLIITCWFGWSAKLIVLILNLIPAVGWGIMLTIGAVMLEFEAHHFFHAIISLVIGIVMFFVTDILFYGEKAISHKILSVLNINFSNDGLLDKLDKKKEEKAQSKSNQEEKQ